jgi:hypothetical protein
LILDRLAVGGQTNQGDLATLSHLIVLESIAAMADIQADMPNSVLGSRLEIQLRQLWDAAAIFEESVSANPLSLRTMTRVQPLYGNIESAYQGVEELLAASAGMSSRAAAHLREITDLTTATSTTMYAIESDLIAAAPVPESRLVNPALVSQQARLLSNEIVALIENVKASKHLTSNWKIVTEDLGELFALVQSFEKTLYTPGAPREIEQSLNAVRRRLWRVEARITKLGWPTDLELRWRGVRQRVNMISDQLGLPRVVDLAIPAQRVPSSAPAAAPKSATRIYRGPP